MPDSPCFSTRLDQQHASLKEPVALFAPLAQLLAAEDGQDLDVELTTHDILCHYLQQQMDLTYASLKNVIGPIYVYEALGQLEIHVYNLLEKKITSQFVASLPAV